MGDARRDRKEADEERAARKAREAADGRRRETDEERAARKAREAAEGGRRKETDEERAARKAREAAEGGQRRETDEERAARKAREAAEGGRRKETEEERAARKEREAKEGRRHETDEERAARKAKEAAEGGRRKETDEERAARKAREAAEGGQRRETDEERAARKEREAKEGRRKETDEERAARKAREREDERLKADERSRREVVHKPLPAALGAAEVKKPAETKPVEKVVVGAPPKPPPQEAAAGEDDDYGYDDDFEEAFAPEELAKATAAVQKENTALKAVTVEKPAAPELQGESRAGLDPNSLRRQKYKKQYEKDLARATTLRRLVDLDVLSATLVDLPPLTEYELFIRNFGGAGRDQKGIQAPPEEDRSTVETQVERIHAKSRALQCPEDLGLFPERTATVVGEEGEGETKTSKAPRLQVDTAALSAFLSRVFPVFRTLMDENESHQNPLARRASFSNQQFSTAVVPLVYEPLAKRKVVDITFSRVATQYLLAVFGPPTAGDELNELNQFESVALLWNVHDPREPDKVLVCHSAITTAAFSVTRPYLIYAGTQCGSVCLWDTREPEYVHHAAASGRMLSPRLPSFSTEWGKDNHGSPVVKVVIAGYNSILGVRSDEAEQLASLDRKGQVSFWRVNEGEAGQPSSSVINETEFGQNIYASVRLSKVGGASALPADSPRGGFSASDLEFVPTDTSHFIVAGTSSLLQLNRFGGVAAPGAYKAVTEWGAPVGATATHYSPTDSRVLVAGYRDGAVRVFLKDDSQPHIAVPLGSAEITRVRCSTSMKWVIFALDVLGGFTVTDLAVTSRLTPVARSDLQEAKAGRCCSFDASFVDKQETKLAFGYERGMVEVHTLNSKMFASASHRYERWL